MKGLRMGVGLSTPPTGAALNYPTLPPLGASYAAVRGTQVMVLGYGGPLFRLRNAANSVAQDFFAAPGLNVPSITAINTWIALNGGAAYPARVYDQTGNGFDITFPTSNTWTIINTTDLAPSGAIFIDTGDALTTEAVSTGHSIDMRDHSLFAVVQNVNGSNGFIAALDDGTNTLSSWAAGKNNIRDRSTAGGYTTYGGWGVQPLRSNPVVVGQTFNASNRRLYCAETSVTAAAAPTGTATRTTYGKSKIGDASYSRWVGDCLTSAALSGADGTALQAALATMFNVPTTFDRRLFLVGDSIMADPTALTNVTKHVPYWTRCNFTGSTEVICSAVAGEQMTTEQASATSFYTPFVTNKYGAGRVVVAIESGINDLDPAIGAKTAAQLSTTQNTFIGQFRAAYANCKVLSMALLPCKKASFDATAQGYIVTYNGDVVANARSNPADLVFQQNDASSTMGALLAPDDTTLYSDKEHPTNQGNKYISGQEAQPLPITSGPLSFQAAVNSLWA